ncbi:MAG: histidinol-phosphate transaminase [Dehalococcoidia bacterium]
MTSLDDVVRLIKSNLRNITPYIPIEPTEVLSKQIDIASENIIKLDGNENPYGCSPKVNQALAGYSFFHIYPDPQQRELRNALAKYTGMNAGCIIAGSGSDELIELILRLFLDPGDQVINCPPTFGMYTFCTDICGGTIKNIHRRNDFSLDVDAIQNAINKTTKVIFIASPNNPTGNTVPESEIIELVNTGIIVVIDEAYAEFSGSTIMPMLSTYPNLFLLRTFSKWAGLAGLRVGYGIFPPTIVEHIMNIKQPYNINAAAHVAAMASLDDIDYLRGTISAIVRERKRLFEKLSTLDWLKPYASDANFILCSVLNGKAKEVYLNLQKKGIFIRYFDTPLLKNCIRITVGKPEHTDYLIAALKEIC